MLTSLQIIEAAARGAGWGAGLAVPCPEAAAAAAALEREGLPLARAFRAAAAQLRRGERLAGEGRRLVRVFQARHALGALVALVVRVGAQRAVAGGADAGAIVLAALLGLAAPVLMRRSLPPIWSADPALVAGWIVGFAGGARGEPAPWSAELEALAHREILLGVSLSGQRRALLLGWARARHVEARHAVERLGDFLPLFELLGIGLPAALLLAAPLLALVKGAG